MKLYIYLNIYIYQKYKKNKKISAIAKNKMKNETVVI